MAKEVIRRGDDYKWYFKLFDKAGLPLPLQNVQVRIVAKSPDAVGAVDDSDAIFVHFAIFNGDGSVESSSGISLGGLDRDTGLETYDVLSGVITERLLPADVTALAAAFDARKHNQKDDPIYAWDLQVRDSAGEHKTMLSGDVYMVPDIGRVRDMG